MDPRHYKVFEGDDEGNIRFQVSAEDGRVRVSEFAPSEPYDAVQVIDTTPELALMLAVSLIRASGANETEALRVALAAD